MPRQARLDAPGTLHHVIVRGIEKRRIFDDQKDRENFISRLGELASATGTARRLAGETGGDRSYLLASHPSPEDRIARIGERVARQGYSVRPTVPLAGDLLTAGKAGAEGP